MPTECKPRESVAIIIPFRGREEHLRILLNNLHPVLYRQQLEYTVYIVEQVLSHNYCIRILHIINKKEHKNIILLSLNSLQIKASSNILGLDTTAASK